MGEKESRFKHKHTVSSLTRCVCETSRQDLFALVWAVLLLLVSIIKRQGVITWLIDQWQRHWCSGGLVF